MPLTSHHPFSSCSPDGLNGTIAHDHNVNVSKDIHTMPAKRGQGHLDEPNVQTLDLHEARHVAVGDKLLKSIAY